jgi:two-component system, cell cycle sensor histidine kinase and response regulator CckA
MEGIKAPTLPASRDELFMLRMAVEASGEVIFLTDDAGTITYVNPEFVRLYGYGSAEVIGRATPRILKGGSTPSEEYTAFWERLSGNEVVRREFVNRTKSGDLIHVESTANPIFSDRRRVGFVAVQRDITDRKATEAALRRSESRYRALAEAAQDSIFIVDRDSRITYANAVSCERFGVEAQVVIGKRLDEAFPPAAAEDVWREVSAVLESGTRHSFETSFETPNGPLWLETWLVPMTNDAGERDAVMGVARDVTARKLLERRFLHAQKMEAIGQLAGGIAHDFNNVLTAILGYSEVLLDRILDDPSLAADVTEIKTAGERAARLTRQLLAFGRKQPLAPEVVDLNEILAELQKMLARVIGEDVRLDIATAPNLDHVKVDPGQIEQVIMNLAVNARDAMPRGGTLRIATANVRLDPESAARHIVGAPGRYVALTVRDTGCGIPPDVLSHVFEPFFTTKPVGKGTGLGLATVYGIVRQSGGQITIDSAPQQGTTVTVYLQSVDDAPAVRPDVATLRSIGGAETILLVEDEEGVRHLMRRTLERAGYAVMTASSVSDALARALDRGRPIDLLLSDVVMPDLSGPDLAQRVVRLHPAMKVLYVSGFTSQLALDSGTLGRRASFLPKPFTPDTLARKVRECLDARF